jgi:hypothetical protein
MASSGAIDTNVLQQELVDLERIDNAIQCGSICISSNVLIPTAETSQLHLHN